VKFRAVLVDRAARELAAALGEPVAAGALGTGLREGDALDALAHLVGADLVEPADQKGTFASDTEPTSAPTERGS
jgi:hypothetical protein